MSAPLSDSDCDRLFTVGLYSLAEGLRMQANGSADPWDAERVDETVAYLRERLACWTDRRERSRRFDNAVRECVEAALEEWAAIEDGHVFTPSHAPVGVLPEGS